MDRRVIAALALLGMAAPAHAVTCDVDGCRWTTTYTEPVATNLQSCTISYSISVDGGGESTKTLVTVPASSPLGGALIAREINNTRLKPGHTYRATTTVRCTNTLGGEGPESAPTTLLLNGVAVPGAPSGVTTQ